MALVEFDYIQPKIGRIVLNEPQNLNAMGEAMAMEFSALVKRLKNEPSLRCLILTGAGRAFSAGGNLEMLDKKRSISKEINYRLMLEFYEAFLSIRLIGVPLIAAINGHAIGAGMCLAAACDIRVAAEGAKLGFTFARLGLHPGMGATYYLPRIIGDARARELMLTGRVITTAEALQIGLLTKVVAGTELISTSLSYAEEILGCGPQCLTQLLVSLRGDEASLTQALKREALCQSENYAGTEFAEGLQAAMEKRRPAF